MRVFELENNIGTDDCAIVNREYVNKSINDYNLYNMFFTSDCLADNAKMYEFANENPNLHYRDGYGVTNGCVVDMDSAMRNDSRITHDRTKIQLCSRWNLAVPDLGRGGLIPNIESRLRNGDDTSVIRVCDKVSEKDFDRFTPLTGCVAPSIQNPNHIIQDNVIRGGSITRNYIFSNTYLEKCGFKNNGQYYAKTNSSVPKDFGPVLQRNNTMPQNQQPRPVPTSM
jgi:hypothetical protein